MWHASSRWRLRVGGHPGLLTASEDTTAMNYRSIIIDGEEENIEIRRTERGAVV